MVLAPTVPLTSKSKMPLASPEEKERKKGVVIDVEGGRKET